MTRPVKKELPRYVEIETPLQEVIWKKWLGSGLTEEDFIAFPDYELCVEGAPTTHENVVEEDAAAEGEVA